MPHIGLFTRTPDGFTGTLRTLSLDCAVVLMRVDHGDAQNASDFRVLLGADGDGPEVGAAWCRTGERAGAYLSLMIDNPGFSRPIHANLFQTNDGSGAHHLVWSRQGRRDARD
jgi:uncharacterized protein (DUF736 family)